MISLKPLKKKRLEHCLSVARLCYDLALSLPCDPMKAYLAGVFHDIARELPKEELLALARSHSIPIGSEEEAEPLLLHGDIAAAVMAENYNITDGEILNAVRRHTVGDTAMTLLDKIVFLADKVEPLRLYKGAAEIREKAFIDFDAAFYDVVRNEIAFCGQQSYDVHPKSRLLLENLKKGETIHDSYRKS